jgi:hypothetical protein
LRITSGLGGAVIQIVATYRSADTEILLDDADIVRAEVTVVAAFITCAHWRVIGSWAPRITVTTP